MTSILRRANEMTQTLWLPPPEGVWRWEIGEGDLALSEQYGSWKVKWPLTLVESERKRLREQHGEPPAGYQQSTRTSYTTGLSLGYVQRDGQYKSTKLVDFLAAALGHQNSRKFRAWITDGGGPRAEEGGLEDEAELEAIRDWLEWWKGLEILGSIRHEPDAVQPGVVWGRFGGPIAIGSLPGQKDADYQAMGLGKLRAMILESGGGPMVTALEVVEETPAQTKKLGAPSKPSAPAAPPVVDSDRYTEIFGDDEPGGSPTQQDIPF